MTLAAHDHAPGCDHHRPRTDFGFLGLEEIHAALEIVLDIGSVQDQIDEIDGFAKDPDRIRDDGQTVEEFLAWCAEQKATWEAARAALLGDLMEWSSIVELGQRAAPLRPEDEARLIDKAPKAES